MQTWKKKLVVSQLALACTLAIASQANATTYDTWTYVDNPTTALDWGNMDNPGTVDGNYVNYSGFVYYNNTNGDFDQSFNGDTVNGTISTYYLNHDYTDGTAGNANELNITDSVIHGSITSELPFGYYGTHIDDQGTLVYDGYRYNNGTTVDAHDWIDGDVFTLNIAHSTIDDDYEALYFTDSYKDGDVTKSTDEAFFTALGVAVDLNVESNINITDNSRVAGIALSQGDTTEDAYTTGDHQWDNNIKVVNSTVTSGSVYPLEEITGHFGNSDEPSDYNGSYTSHGVTDDTALAFIDSNASDYRMVNKVEFDNSTLMGDVYFESTFNHDFSANGRLVDGSDKVYTHGGWADDDQNVDHLTLTLDHSKWIGAAYIDYDQVEYNNTFGWADVAPNSLDPDASYSYDNWGRTDNADIFQSGIFDVVLNNGSEWDTTKDSLIDSLAINTGSQVNVADGSSLTSDSIILTDGSALNISEDGVVDTDNLTIDSYSTVKLSDEVNSSWSKDGAALYANHITVTNGGVLDVQTSNTGASSLFETDTLNLTSGDVAHSNDYVNSGVFNIHSNDYVLNADLVNNRTNDKTQANYGYGTIAMNSDGHLTVNGNGNLATDSSTNVNPDEVDNNDNVYAGGNDNVVAATGNYKVRIDNATGAGSIADYKGKELIYVDDVNTNATFSAANKADLGAYTYQAQQEGNTVVLRQMELTDYANMALSIPSANTNIWNLQQDTLSDRLTSSRHGFDDNGGAWVSYFGGSFDADNGTINYDQDVNGIMVGVDTKVDGNNAKWIVGAAASFAKGDMSDRTGQVDQDSQSAYIYSSARFANNIFVDGNLSYSRFDNDLTATMSNGAYVDGNTTADAWGFGLKLGYDWKINDAGYVTPYASINGLFQSGDSYRLSNDANVGGQDYDSLRYEAGLNAGYTFNYGDQALTPYFNLAYVYDDSDNDSDFNGDNIDNGVKGSAVRVGAGGQFSFTKNFSGYTGVTYLGGGDVDQDWAANAGVKYTW